MLAKKAKYGIKALIYICNHAKDGPIPIKRIAEAENIPSKFLEAILSTLKSSGILSSKKGRYGGYYLRKDPERIFMSEVFRLLSGPISMVSCVSLNYYEKCDDCPNEELCGYHRLMLEVRDTMLEVLKGKSLANLAAGR